MKKHTADDVLSGGARWCVIEGDCLDAMAGMRNGCVDHVITDPPYEAEAHTKQRRCRDVLEGRAVSAALWFDAMTDSGRIAVSQRMSELLRRWCLVFCQVEASQKWATAFTVDYIRTMVWDKPDGCPQFTGDRPGMGYESIVVLHPPGEKRWNAGGKRGVYRCNTGKNTTGHPTQKPLDLMLDLIRDFTDPDDLILDPFCGSGTTGVAALKLGRRAILIEKDPKYAEIACRRMLDAEEEIAAEGGEVRTYSKPRQTGLFTKR